MPVSSEGSLKLISVKLDEPGVCKSYPGESNRVNEIEENSEGNISKLNKSAPEMPISSEDNIELIGVKLDEPEVCKSYTDESHQIEENNEVNTSTLNKNRPEMCTSSEDSVGLIGANLDEPEVSKSYPTESNQFNQIEDNNEISTSALNKKSPEMPILSEGIVKLDDPGVSKCYPGESNQMNQTEENNEGSISTLNNNMSERPISSEGNVEFIGVKLDEPRISQPYTGETNQLNEIDENNKGNTSTLNKDRPEILIPSGYTSTLNKDRPEILIPSDDIVKLDEPGISKPNPCETNQLNEVEENNEESTSTLNKNKLEMCISSEDNIEVNDVKLDEPEVCQSYLGESNQIEENIKESSSTNLLISNSDREAPTPVLNELESSDESDDGITPVQQESDPAIPEHSVDSSLKYHENFNLPSPSSSSIDSTTNEHDDESNIPKRAHSLPYFKLPNPDLEEFLKEKEKSFCTPEIDTSIHSRTPRRIFEPQEKSDIVFTLDSTPSISDSRNSLDNQHYEKMLTSINTLDDSKCPGLKRTALKRFLKNKIEERKILSFELQKQFSKNEEDEENICEFNDEEEEENMCESESSSATDDEEPVVLFGKEQNSSEMKSPENSEDDNDDFLVPKSRKLRILDDDSADELDADNPAKATELLCEDTPNSVHGGSPSKEFSNDGDEFAETTGIDSSLPSYQPGGGFYEKEDSDCIETYTPEKMEATHKYSMAEDSNTQGVNNSMLKEREELVPPESPRLGLYLDDPPISQENVSMFSTQDLANVCSGVFKATPNVKLDEEQNSEDEIDTEQNFEDEVDEEEQKKIQEFFDVEAELSGEDDDAPDDLDMDSDEAENILDLVDDNELPEEEQLRDEIADLHMKRIRDEDEEILKDLQEKFIEDGELAGSGRTRRFKWANSDVPISMTKDSSSDSESDEEVNSNWALNKEKAKWLHEKADVNEEAVILESCKKMNLKMKILGKPEYIKKIEESRSLKRPRGSLLNLEDNDASKVLKKLKTSETDGSITTKHFVFRSNETTVKKPRETSSDSKMAAASSSIFNDIKN